VLTPVGDGADLTYLSRYEYRAPRETAEVTTGSGASCDVSTPRRAGRSADARTGRLLRGVSARCTVIRRPSKRKTPPISGASTHRKFSARSEYAGNSGQRTANIEQRIQIHRRRQERLAFERQLRMGKLAQSSPMIQFPI
jgi:hypothetical protein